jgi:hypothetical protein
MKTTKDDSKMLGDLERCERLLADLHRLRDRTEIELARLIGSQADGTLLDLKGQSLKNHLEHNFRDHTTGIKRLRRAIAQLTVNIYSVGGATNPDIEWME